MGSDGDEESIERRYEFFLHTRELIAYDSNRGLLRLRFGLTLAFIRRLGWVSGMRISTPVYDRDFASAAESVRRERGVVIFHYCACMDELEGIRRERRLFRKDLAELPEFGVGRWEWNTQPDDMRCE